MSANAVARRSRWTIRAIALLLICSMVGGVVGPGTPWTGSTGLDAQEALRQAMGLSPKQLPARGDVNNATLSEDELKAGNQALPKSLQSKYPPIAFARAEAPPNDTKVQPGPSAVHGFDASSREVPDKRTATENTYTNTDGTLTTEFSDAPINYRTPAGTYEHIDTTLVDAGADWRNRADAVEVRLGKRSDATAVAKVVLDKDHEVAFGVTASAVNGQVDGSSVTYPGVRQESDLRFDVQPGGLKETIFLRSANAPRDWEFPLRTKGLRAALVDGRIALIDEKGVERLTFPRGSMIDATQAESNGVTYELTRDTLRVHLDAAWLQDPSRHYPVAVDPTVETFGSSASMYVQGGSRTDGGVELRAGTYGGGTVAASYLRFDDVRARLADQKIFGAQLILTNAWSWSCQPRPVTVHEVTSDWGGGGGFPGPSFGPELVSQSFAHGYIGPGSTRSPCPTATEAMNLGEGGRDVVQRWANGGANFGLTVRASSTDTFGWKKFTGRNTANPPRLYVTHTPYNADYRIDNGVIAPPVTRTQGGKVKITVTNRGAQTWTPASFALGYRVFTSRGTPIASTEAASLPHDVGRGETVTLDANVGPLDPDDYYLDFSMLQRNVAWFTDEQIPPARIVLRVVDIPPVIKAQYPPNGFSSATLTPQLWVDAVDLDTPPNRALQYRFEVCERYDQQSDGSLKGVNCVDSGRVNSRYWTVPRGAIKWSKDYQWRAFAFDGTTESPALPPSHLLTAVPQPEITAHLANAPYSGGNSDFDPQTGNYYTSAIDTTVGTTGPDLSVVRTYNSLDPRRDLLFGAGWSSRYDMRVVPDQDDSGNAVVTYPDGQQVRFGRNGDGTFAPPEGRIAKLATGPPDVGGWVLTDQAGTVYTFRLDGRLISNKDESGHWTELDYGTPERLKRAISRTSGRTLYFTYTGGHVSTVKTDPMDGKQLTWTYSYDADKLTKVCDPKGGCTNYDYVAGSHYRSAVIDSRPSSYWRLGETAGADAGSQVMVNLGKDKATYKDVVQAAPGALSGTTDGAAGFNGTSSAVTLPDGTLRKARDLGVEMWFKTATGGPLLGYQNKTITEDSTAGTPVLYVGTDGRLRGSFANGTVAPITTTALVNDDKWHHVALSGSLATQTMYLDGQPVGTAAGEIVHSDLTFNQVGAAYAINPTTWPQWGTTARRFFAGQIDEVAFYEHSIGQSVAQAHVNARAGSDALAKITLPSGRIAAKMTYDATNDRLLEYTDDKGGVWKLSLPIVTGSATNLIRTTRVTDPGNRFQFYDYDPFRNRILRYSAPLGLGVRDEDRRTQVGEPTPPSVPTCPAPPPPPGGDPVYCGGPSNGGSDWVGGPVHGQGLRTYDYDASGFQTTVIDENGNAATMTTDARGNVTARKTCRVAPGDCQTAYYTYFLNPDDPTDPRNDKITSSRDARSTGPLDPKYATIYAYTNTGQRGLLASQSSPDGGQVTHVYTTATDTAIGGGTTPAGLIATTTDPRGGTVHYGYYSNGDLAQVTSPTGMVVKYTYDVLGRKISQTQVSDAYPQGLTTTYTYDELSHQTSVTPPATTNTVTGVTHTARTSTSYDPDGNPVRVDVADLTGGDAARTSTIDYDQHGLPTRTTDPEGGVTTQGYDGYGNQVWNVDANGTKTEYAYTARNMLAEVRVRAWHGEPVDTTGTGGDGDGDVTPMPTLVLDSYGYDMAGRLVRHTDPMGRITRYEYYNDDKVFRVSARDVRDPFNPSAPTRNIVLQRNTYDAAGNLTQQTSATGQVTVNEYDPTGRIAATTQDPTGLQRKTAFDYDKSGNVVRVTRTGNPSNSTRLDTSRIEKTEFAYDTAGRETGQTAYNGQEQLVTTTTYDQRGNVRTSTNPRGFTTSFDYDELGRQISSTSPQVQVERVGGQPTTERLTTKTGYDTFGDATQAVDADGNVTTQFYDRRSLPTRIESPPYQKPGEPTAAKSVVQTQYDALGHPITVTDPLGAITRYRYDQLGRLVEKQDPKPDAPTEPGGIWRTTYTPNGEPLSVTDPTGARTETTYDDLGRPATATQLERRPQPAAYTTKFRYDDDGHLTQSTTPAGESTTYTYDKVGARITATDPAGVITRFGYDISNNLARVSDALNRTTWTLYDGLGRAKAQYNLDPQEQILRRASITYDKSGNVASATDTLNHTQQFTYDALGRQTGQTEPISDTDSITTSFGYDARGNRTRLTDGRGNSTTSTFNVLGRTESTIEPSTTTHPNASDRTWTVGYDLAGQPTTVAIPGGVTRQRTFDALGRLTNETGTGAEAATEARVVSYDLAGRLTSVNAPTGTDVYTYNDRGALLTTTGNGGTSSYTYDPNGRPTQRIDSAGTHTSTYTNGRLATVQDGQTGVVESLSYDNAGAVKTIDYGTGRTRTFSYDDLGRLRTDVLAAGTTSIASVNYDYNPADQLTGKKTTGTGPAQDNTYAYDYLNRLTSWTNNGTTTNYTWDKSGNRTQNGTKTATYDERNRVQSDGDSTYTWTARGTLTSRTTNGTAATYTFDAFDRAATNGGTTYRYDGLDRLSTRNNTPFAYLGTGLDLVSDGTSTYSRDNNGTVLALTQGTDKRLTLTDQHGDLVGGFNPDTALTGLADSATYDPFGTTLNTTGTQRSLGYQSDYTDPTNGHIDMGARWYNPTTSAFTARDNISLPSTPSTSTNRYTYANSSPATNTDPTGHLVGVLAPVGVAACVATVACAVGIAAGTVVVTGALWLAFGGDSDVNAHGTKGAGLRGTIGRGRGIGGWQPCSGTTCVNPPPCEASICPGPPPPPGPGPGPGRTNNPVRSSHVGPNGRGGSDGGVDATWLAREKALQVARWNPLPVPVIATLPFYADPGNGTHPPVSSNPNAPADVTSTSQVVDQTSLIQDLIDKTLKNTGPVIQNVVEEAASELAGSDGKLRPDGDGNSAGLENPQVTRFTDEDGNTWLRNPDGTWRQITWSSAPVGQWDDDIDGTSELIDDYGVTVYRAQRAGGHSERVHIDAEGDVTISGDAMIHVNMSGNIAHTEVFRGAESQIIAFDVPRSFLDEIRAAAIGQRRPKGMSRREWNIHSVGRPQIDDPKVAADLYGIPHDLFGGENFSALLDAVIPGSGRVIR